MKTEFVIVDSAAKMPNKCWGRYRRVAVLEIEAGTRVSRIDDRPRNVRRIVRLWDRLNVGKTERCAYERGLAAAEELVAELEANAAEKAELTRLWAEIGSDVY